VQFCRSSVISFVTKNILSFFFMLGYKFFGHKKSDSSIEEWCKSLICDKKEAQIHRTDCFLQSAPRLCTYIACIVPCVCVRMCDARSVLWWLPAVPATSSTEMIQMSGAHCG
jgi:hypothetical protein